MPAAIAAPRAFDDAAALYLALYSDFPDRFRWDGPARVWRRAADGWAPARPEVVIADTTDVLRSALSAESVPLVFRCVFAPASRVAALEAVTDENAWRASEIARARAEHERFETRRAAERAELEATASLDVDTLDAPQRLAASIRRASAQKALARWRDLPPFAEPRPRLLDDRQRERLLRAVNHHNVYTAVRLASGRPECAYRAKAAPVDVDPRAWLASLPRTPGVVTLSSALYRAYVAALSPGVRPCHEREFHRLAVEVLGDGDARACQTHRNGRRFYRNLALSA